MVGGQLRPELTNVLAEGVQAFDDLHCHYQSCLSAGGEELEKAAAEVAAQQQKIFPTKTEIAIKFDPEELDVSHICIFTKDDHTIVNHCKLYQDNASKKADHKISSAF